MAKKQISELQELRLKFKPELPLTLQLGAANIKVIKGKPTSCAKKFEGEVKKMFANTYGLPEVKFAKGKNDLAKRKITLGVVLSGGQAAGGHNVIAGLFDGLKKANPKNALLGFLNGPAGIIDNKVKVIDVKIIDEYRNTGGFDLICSGRTKIETPEQFEAAKNTLIANKVNALVVVGGDDSNTNAALIAEYLKQQNLDICVIGVPKTIDGDLKNEYIETSFGFDTATKIYAELAGNIARDINSARKYWHFIRLMGRSASHITLEVAFKTQPNIVLVGEEVLAKKMTLAQVVNYMTDIISKRAAEGKNFGLALLPEGLIEFIPEMKELISALNDLLSNPTPSFSTVDNNPAAAKTEDVENGLIEKFAYVQSQLPKNLSDLFKSLPENIAAQLLLDRDPHGNVLVSQIETEKLLVEMIAARLAELKKAKKFNGKFASITHFFGYEGRCGFPSNFDANYTYALGYNAAVLALNNLTGYISSVRNLIKQPKQWICGGIPLTMMLNIEKRHGSQKAVIAKALVDLNGKPFKALCALRKDWAFNDNYLVSGPIQFFGPASITDITTKTLQYEYGKGAK
ncbi:MAG: diphosphate--fructose-6-phosphate 1-phosphotransferase [Elusimicrobiota bacterium]|jgi:pyrophosphate--fructose-6-phosphate 1-phosphotransferase|nr:diphosphate--fructose-6-phosphate 1-phosphotransferase [Elusimicrobiota bacterium]